METTTNTDMETTADTNITIIQNDQQKVENKDESTTGSQLWRFLVQTVIRLRADTVNRYRLTRALQSNITFQGPLEALLLDKLICALDDNADLNFHLKQAMKNQTIRRIVVTSLGQFDILWHNFTRLKWLKLLDFLGDFPVTELDADSMGNTLNMLTRKILGEGKWWSRYLSSNRESFESDNSKKSATAQNLAVGNSFESTLRAQHGTTFGRQYLNKFRSKNRIPVDEIIIRSFTADPIATIADNGVEQ
eukprot:Awhi_evm1s4810